MSVRDLPLRRCRAPLLSADGTVALVKAIRRFSVRTVLPAALAPLGSSRSTSGGRGTSVPRSFSAVSTPRHGTRRSATRCACWARWARPARGARGGRRRRTPGAGGRGQPARLPLGGPLVPAPPARCRRWRADRAVPRTIAYFSPEFGITEVLPQYSGGLGILAGDHLKAASDLGVPIVGVGLLYRERATSRSRCPVRAGSRSATPCSTPTDCRSRCCATRTTSRSRCASACPAAGSWSRRSGRPRSAGCRCCCSTPTSRTTSRPSAT